MPRQRLNQCSIKHEDQSSIPNPSQKVTYGDTSVPRKVDGGDAWGCLLAGQPSLIGKSAIAMTTCFKKQRQMAYKQKHKHAGACTHKGEQCLLLCFKLVTEFRATIRCKLIIKMMLKSYFVYQRDGSLLRALAALP